MKQFNKTFFLSTALAVLIIPFSSFNIAKEKKSKPATAYTITFLGMEEVGTNYQWTWSVLNPNPGNGSNGTLQNVSHWDLPLCALAESALVSAEYSYNGTTWTSVSIDMDRDPSIRVCTSVDVLKFNVGTTGSAPLYCRITFDRLFIINPIAVSYIKTGGGLQGCNVYTYTGVGCEVPPNSAPRND